MEKIRSGIFGLNRLLDGGINENSTTVVIGAAGAGKTTMATQFIRRGLEDGQDGVFVSLDENQDQIIREAEEMGWSDITDYIERRRLVFIDASGKKFSQFIREELPDFVEHWTGGDARIVIDPLTPVIWAMGEHYEQREILSFLFKEARQVGTVLCTLEKHNASTRLQGDETIIPMYLADSVIHLNTRWSGGSINRTLEIVKCRSSRHSTDSHKYDIIKGLGLVVERKEAPEEPDRGVPQRMFAELESHADALPPQVLERTREVFAQLSDRDLANIDPGSLVADILEEYR